MTRPALPLRAVSPVAGLRRRSLPPVGVFAQSVATSAPSAAMASTPLLVAADAGRGALWSFGIATALVGLVAACIAVFARRMAAAGGLYSFTAKGLGPAGGYACAAAMIVGYGVLVGAALVGASWYALAVAQRWAPSVAHGWGSVATRMSVLVLLGVVVGVCAVRGVRFTGRLMLVVEGISTALILLVLVGLAFVADPPPAWPPPAPPTPPGVAGVCAGTLPALAAFIGFDGAAALGVEARRPLRTVPRAVGMTAVVAAGLYLIAALIHLREPGILPALSAGFAYPGVPTGGFGWAAVLVDVGVVASFTASALAALSTVTRVLFSLARDGVVPRVLGRTHPRHATPAPAVGLAVPVLLVPPVVGTALVVAPEDLLRALLAVAALGFLAAYLLVSAAAPWFLASIGERRPSVVLAAAIAVPGMTAVVAGACVQVSGQGWGLTLVAVVAAGLGGWLMLRRHRPAALREIGVYDEPTTQDLLLEASSR